MDSRSLGKPMLFHYHKDLYEFSRFIINNRDIDHVLNPLIKLFNELLTMLTNYFIKML